MVRAGLEADVDAAIDRSISERTRRRYAAAWERYRTWCEGLEEDPLPVTEEKIVPYVMSLAKDGLKNGAVKYHLAALRMAHIKAGLRAPVWSEMGRLGQLRKGLIQKSMVDGEKGLVRNPIRWFHMQTLREAWRGDGDRGCMLWAAACMCFFGCLRAGEALAPEFGEFDAKAHLAWEDVMLERAASRKCIGLRIKESKTDRQRAGAMVTLHKTGTDICPVESVLRFMVTRGAGPGPFFTDREGVGLTRRVFVEEVRKALAKKGASVEGISGHSFRIGAATAAAESGATAEEVKALGRWKSGAYSGYVRREEGGQTSAGKKWTRAIKEGCSSQD